MSNTFRGSVTVSMLCSFCCILLALFVNNVACQNPCRTPSNSPGTCIPLNTCSYLLTILQNRNRPPTETKLLRDSQCGAQGNMPLVCCPQIPSVIPCVTPDNTQGTCIDIKKCPHLLGLITGPRPLPTQTVQYLRSSACQGPDKYSVCCAQQNLPHTASSSTTLRPIPTQPRIDLIDTEEIPVNDAEVDALLPPPTECGKDAAANRIFGGEVTDIDQYPWMALVGYRTKRNTISLGCGASLISKRYIVTAGHCVVGSVLVRLGTPVNIRLGEFNKTSLVDCVPVPGGGEDCNDEPVIIEIEKIIPHPDYQPATGSHNNDIALIRIASDAPYTDFIRAICLPRSDVTSDNPLRNMVVSGWGAIETGRFSEVKLHLAIKMVGLAMCQAAYDSKNLNAKLWDKQLCAGGEKGKDSCRGDSGGPLMSEHNLQWTLHGVVSFGPTPCGLEDVPGVYTKVFAYLKWIRSNIKP